MNSDLEVLATVVSAMLLLFSLKNKNRVRLGVMMSPYVNVISVYLRLLDTGDPGYDCVY